MDALKVIFGLVAYGVILCGPWIALVLFVDWATDSG